MYKNQEIEGYFISKDGKIFDENGVEQELKLYPSSPYYFFKSREVHVLMCHSFFEYKEGLDVHHKNFDKLDNRLDNLVYLTHAEHTRIHWTGKKFSDEHKAKIGIKHKGKKLSEKTKALLRAAHEKKPVYCLELDRVFESISVASKELYLKSSHISECCRGKRKTARKIAFHIFQLTLIY